ncbi:MAG: putative O-glycosylation ligase, exosortase A system-associated [Rhodocyclaceae bacterium]|nr:putative O-glycosylation ligase, exosortase A system-associated [Rhodocyclaceae bacterium]
MLPVILAALGNAYFGVLAWTWISMMSPHKLAYGFARDLPWALMIAITTIIGFVASKQRQPFPKNFLAKLMVVFALWTCVTTAFSLQQPDVVMPIWEKVMKIQFMLFLTMMVVRGETQIKELIWVIVCSVGFYGVKGGIFTALTGGGQRVWGPPGGFIEGNNELALALSTILPLMVYLATQTPRPWVRKALWGAIGCIMLAILGSHSRGAFLALLTMALFLGWNSNKRVLTIVGLSILLALLVAFMPDNWTNRMETIAGHEDNSAQSRLSTWRMLWNLALHNPITGAGFEVGTRDNWAAYSVDEWNFAYAPHSIYFQALGEHGFVGLFIYIGLGVSAWRLSKRVEKSVSGDDQFAWVPMLMRMVRVALLAFATGGAFLGLVNYDLPFYLVAVVALTDASVREARLRAEKAAPANGMDHAAEHPRPNQGLPLHG